MKSVKMEEFLLKLIKNWKTQKQRANQFHSVSSAMPHQEHWYLSLGRSLTGNGWNKRSHYLLHSFFWVIPWRLNFMCWHFGTLCLFIGVLSRELGTLCLFHLHRHCKQEEFFLLTTPMKMEETECSEMSAHKIQMLGNHPKERIQHSDHGKSWKSRIKSLNLTFIVRAS